VTKPPDNEDQALESLRKAVANALDRKRRLGQYAVVWHDGRPVHLEPEELGSAVDYGIVSSVREPDPGGGDNGDNRK